MSSLNKVHLLGRVGKDPDIRTTQNGDKCANFPIATSESWKDKQGQKQERTEWHNVVIWGSLAAVVEQFVRKGTQIYIEGQLQTRKWLDKNGQDRYTTEVVLKGFNSNLILLGGNGKNDNQSNHSQTSQQAQQPIGQADLDDEILF